MTTPFERHGAYCPWLHDPDPPEPIMTPEESKAAAQRMVALMRRRQRAEAKARAASMTPEEAEEALREV